MSRSIGYESKAWLAPAPLVGIPLQFAVKKFNLPVEFDKHEVGDTLSGGFKQHRSGRVSAQMTADFYADTTIWLENPAGYNMATSYILNGGQFYAEVWTKGAQVPAPGGGAVAYGVGGKGKYIIPSMCITKKSPSGAVDEPVSIAFEGWANGQFFDPVD